MKSQFVSSRNFLAITVVSAVLLAGVVACDSPFTLSIPGVGDIGIGTGDSNTNDNGADDTMNANGSDDEFANDNANDDEGTEAGANENDNDNGHDDDDGLEGDDGDGADDEGADDDGDGMGAGSLIGDVDAGGSLFASTCAVCHGDDASGVVGPNIQGEEFGEILEHAVSGHEGHMMFDLLDQDVADIEAFLATLGQ